MSLINQLQQCVDQLAVIHQRTKEESSQFQWPVHTALTSIQIVLIHMQRCLERDTNDDSPYIPALREILPADMDD